MANDKKNKIKARIQELRAELEEHNRRYYVNNAPIISDFEFDALMRDLESLEKLYPEFATADSPTQKVGSDIAETYDASFAGNKSETTAISSGTIADSANKPNVSDGKPTDFANASQTTANTPSNSANTSQTTASTPSNSANGLQTTANTPTNATSKTKSKSKFAQYPHRYPMLSLGNTYNVEELASFTERVDKMVVELHSESSLETNTGNKATAKSADESTQMYTNTNDKNTSTQNFAATNLSNLNQGKGQSQGKAIYSTEYSCELKFDGTAICLTYSKGTLVRALTRGDGSVGDDVTANVLTIPSIPRHVEDVDFDFEIRGEIYMPYHSFNALNAEKLEVGDQPFANPRNAAAGTLKTLDTEEVRRRGLECVLYHILGENLPFKYHSEAMYWASQHGFPVSSHSRVCHSLNEINNYITNWNISRKTLPFATDGIVIKVNNLELQQALGYTAKSPRWATAYKFQPERALTPLRSIDYQVGRTGAITPVANLDPVPLSGTIVKRASLHNSEQMEALDIRIGDYVYVEKGGEIIPKITGVEKAKRPADAQVPLFPTLCPDCASPLVKNEEEARHYCVNEQCPTRVKGAFLHFISRKAMDINAGDATIDTLYNQGWIRTLPDLYRVTMEQLLTLDGWKDKSASNFLESLQASKAKPFHSVLFALGIRHIGETTAKTLTAHFGTIEAMIRATREEYLAVDDIGGIIANALVEYFADSRHIKMIEELRSLGLQFSAQKKEALSDKLKGCNIVISGNFSISRDAMKELIEQHGGKNTSSVTGKTTYLLAGEKPGPEKIKKAENMKIKVISEEEFHDLIKEN